MRTQEFFLCYVFSGLPWRLTPHGNIAALCLPSEKDLLQVGAMRFWKRGYFSPRNLPILKDKDLTPIFLKCDIARPDNHIKGTPGAYQENGSHDMLG